MSLRTRAAADLRSIVEDPAGFGWPITVTNPAGASAPFYGFSQDIGQVIDPLTGVSVSGRVATVALSQEAIDEAGLGQPAAVPEESAKPWTVVFEDATGNSYTFKIFDVMPDRTIGLVVYRLEAYRP